MTTTELRRGKTLVSVTDKALEDWVHFDFLETGVEKKRYLLYIKLSYIYNISVNKIDLFIKT